jgi:VanZ family protein
MVHVYCMCGPIEQQTSFDERKLLRWLLLFYCLFILYGSFIPFRFSDDPEFVRSQLTRFFTSPYAHGIRRFSVPDVVSNILLFVPFGFLWAGAEVFPLAHAKLRRSVIPLGILGLLTGLMIESGQMFSPGRTASILDALCNGLGAAMGAAAGQLLFRAFRGSFGLLLLQLLRQHPAVVLLALLLLASAADAYYPFDVTLDVSTVWRNIKNARLIPFSGGLRRFWLDLFIEKILLFAAVGYLAYRSLAQNNFPASRRNVWAGCSIIALLIEGGKLFFAGRAPNIDNVLLSSLGALGGVLFIPPLAATGFARRYGRRILITLILCVVAYAELSPFDWILSTDEIRQRLSKIEWLPFGSYYRAEPQAALFDLAKKLFLLGPLGFLIAAGKNGGGARKRQTLAVVAGLTVGLIFESGQIALQSRSPSITDVLLFGGACWAGAAIFDRYRFIQRHPNSVVEPGAIYQR